MMLSVAAGRCLTEITGSCSSHSRDKFVFLCAAGDGDFSKGFRKSVYSAEGVESLVGCLVHTDSLIS